MKILHVVPTYLPAVRYGGPIQSVHGLCRALVARGHSVEVFTTNVDGDGTSPVPVGVPVDLDGVAVRYFPVPLLRRLYWSPAMGRALQSRLAEFDIVHLHSVFLWPTWAAARTARRLGVPYVLAPRGMLVADLIRRKSRWVKRAWIAMVERRTLAEAAVVHFTSAREAEDAAQLGLQVRSSCVVPNGLDLPLDRGQGSETVSVPMRPDVGGFLLFVGRINWKKGLDRLIAALPVLSGQRLLVVGNDEEGLRPKLEALASRLGVRERISFAGPVYGADKEALYRSALLLVLPSHSENFGNVVLEAMAAGCPVVVTPEVGAADIVRASGAGAVLDGDPPHLGAGIAGLVSDPAMLRRMGENGRRYAAAHCTWEAVGARMEAAYSLVLGDFGKASQ